MLLWTAARSFAKRQAAKEGKAKKRTEEKEQIAREFEGLDVDALLQEVNGKLEASIKTLREKLRSIVMAKVSPQICEQLIIITKEGEKQLGDIADFNLKNANTMLIIPHDDSLKELIYKVCTIR